MNRRRLLLRLLNNAVSNVAFADMVSLVEGFGFRLVRTRGSHQVFTHPIVPEFVNIQNVNGKTKQYQIRQILRGRY